MADEYSFGIEIEITATPRETNGQTHSRAYYYEKFAQALQARGLHAKANDGLHRKRIEEYENRWFITTDGSISSSGSSSVELEAVSPILYTSKDWEGTIDKFWKAQGAVFHMPAKSASCGSHVHIAPGLHKRWNIEQLRNIAVGIACYEKYVRDLLPAERRDNQYCRDNTSSSAQLRGYYSDAEGWNSLLPVMKTLGRASLINLMQGTDRRVLWNFLPAADDGIGTIEFRGGQCLRGHNRTKWWIAFAVAYIHFLLTQKICTRGRFPEIRNTRDLYAKIRRSARTLDLARHLPQDYRVLNETRREAAGSGSSIDAPAPRYRSFLPNAYPAEPPPAYTAPPRPPRSYTPPSLELGRETTNHVSRHETRGEDGDACDFCLQSVLYVGLRFLQLVLSIAVFGMYMHASNEKAMKNGNANSMFAKVVAGMSLVTAVVAIMYLVGLAMCGTIRDDEKGLIRRIWRYEWLVDVFLFILWLGVFGAFGAKYIPQGEDHGYMLNAVWLDLVNMLLRLITCLYTLPTKHWNRVCCDD